MSERSRFYLLTTLFLALISGLGPASASAQGNVRRNVEVDWEVVDGATGYEVQVIRKDDRKKQPTRFKTQSPSWSATIKPGLYIMQVRSYDDRGVPGDWSPPSDLQVKLPSVVMTSPGADTNITSTDADKQEILFKWEAVPGAEKYKVSARTPKGTWQEEKEVTGVELSIKAPVGEQIEWNVSAVDRSGEVGDVNPVPQAFQVTGPPLTKPDITKPLSKYIEEIEWAPAPNAKSYAFELSYRDPKTKKWRKVDSKSDIPENKIKWDISRPSGRYRLKVQAKGERRKPSTVAVLQFEARGGFRDPAALETAILRDSLSKPTNFYAIASYLVTDIQYQAANYDSNTTPTFSALGGTGRVGLGYQDPESQWGGFGIVDMSGFTISGSNFTFASSELHLTHKLEFGQGGLLLFGTGLFSKELPIIKGSQIVGFTGVGKVRQIGPHAGFIYWYPLTQRFGLQANARLYYTMLGSTTPGGKVDSSESYQYGLMGSYRISPAWMGYAGYAFRKDQAEYGVNTGDANSFASSGEINVINIQGHYLNLILEYSF